MGAYFEQMDSLLRLFWFIALPISVIFLVQSIMTFVGVDASDGVEADFDGNLDAGDTPFQLFSFRNLVNFLLGFGWTGIAFYHTIANASLLIIVAILVGVSFVALFFFIMKKINGLAEDNTFQLQATLNQVAEVYLPIPANKQGKGKIQLSVKGTVHEIDAITAAENKIETGAMVRVVGIDNQLLIVQKI
jgi:hypothetical protein